MARIFALLFVILFSCHSDPPPKGTPPETALRVQFGADTPACDPPDAAGWQYCWNGPRNGSKGFQFYDCYWDRKSDAVCKEKVY